MQFIDLRSDTTTHPTQEMRDSILNCKVGDDVYGDDPTVLDLQKLASEMLQKEACLLVPSGTMGNHLALICAVETRGDEVLMPERCHIITKTGASIGVLSGAQVRFYEAHEDYINPSDIENQIRKFLFDFYPKTAAIVIEQPTLQGYVIPLETLKQIYDIAQKWKVHVHMDASRLFNAAHVLQVNPSDIVQYADSVMICLSKGLCAPVGSLLLGKQDFITKAKRFRKKIGGGMRQVGVIAAPGIIALQKMIEPLKEDHQMGRLLAQVLRNVPYIKDIRDTMINFVFFRLDESIDKEHFKQYMESKRIKIKYQDDLSIKFYTHHYIRQQQVELIVAILKEYV